MACDIGVDVIWLVADKINSYSYDCDSKELMLAYSLVEESSDIAS